jgi:hypothetical protein
METPEQIRFTNAIYMQQNFIDVADTKVPVFRVFPVVRLLQAFITRKLDFLPPEKWEDPFENVVLRHRVFEGLRTRIYGQCWTLNDAESDALWRIYSPDKQGVRVRSTVAKVFDSIADTTKEWALLEYWAGRVRYLSEAEIKRRLEDPALLQLHVLEQGARGLVETLLIKRLEFQHENELRFLYLGHEEYFDLLSAKASFGIDPAKVFESLLFDPRMEDDLFETYRQVFRKLGFTGAIERSLLYRVPDLNLTLPYLRRPDNP